jgi:hypothetical protein
MQEEKVNTSGLAIVLAWPYTTARGDERWYRLLKMAGIVKNLNFRVGHAAMVLVEAATGQLHYYDFGRYITPRGLGRARAAWSDPKLTLHTKAQISQTGEIENLWDIAEELKNIASATHGIGPLYFSVSEPLHFPSSKKKADEWVHRGSTPYGALARGNNSCSRYVWQVVAAGWRSRRWTHRLHETLFPSPISNVVNAHPSRRVYIHDNRRQETLRMTRSRSLLFFIDQISINLSRVRSQQLADDRIEGSMPEPTRPAHLPDQAQWLGGIGEGAWYTWEVLSEHSVEIRRYFSTGELEFVNKYQSPVRLTKELTYSITYDTHFHTATLLLESEKIRLHPLSFKD